MKLWQAILAGCDRREQAIGLLFDYGIDGTCKSCALGAAWEGHFNTTIGSGFIMDEEDRLRRAFPILMSEVKHPLYTRREQRLRARGPSGAVIPDKLMLEAVIVDLNDQHRWSREEIALKFLKPLEDELDEANS